MWDFDNRHIYVYNSVYKVFTYDSQRSVHPICKFYKMAFLRIPQNRTCAFYRPRCMRNARKVRAKNDDKEDGLR